MNTCVEVSHTDNTEADRENAPAESKQYKSKRYAQKQNPEALAKLKEYHKENTKKENNIKQLEKLGVVISRPYTKQTPEALYRTSVEKVYQLHKNYIRREEAKVYSPFLNHRREHARAY